MNTFAILLGNGSFIEVKLADIINIYEAVGYVIIVFDPGYLDIAV